MPRESKPKGKHKLEQAPDTKTSAPALTDAQKSMAEAIAGRWSTYEWHCAQRDQAREKLAAAERERDAAARPLDQLDKAKRRAKRAVKAAGTDVAALLAAQRDLDATKGVRPKLMKPYNEAAAEVRKAEEAVYEARVQVCVAWAQLEKCGIPDLPEQPSPWYPPKSVKPVENIKVSVFGESPRSVR